MTATTRPLSEGRAAGATETKGTRGDRLDRLPFTRKHARILTSSGLGWALDAMDVGLVSFVIAALAVQWTLSPQQTSLIVAIGFAGMALGATIGGLLADRIGRRAVFAITLLVFGIATGLSALAWSVGALLVLRFLAGFGLGAELPVASTYVSEFAPARIRGRIVVLLEGFWAIGWILAAVIGTLVIPGNPDGWRWALLIGAVPAIYAAVIRFGLPESVRFLESRGRFTEAERIVRDFEASAGVASPDAAPQDHTDAASAAPAPIGARQRLTQLWAPARRRSTAALWIVWFCVNFSYYGAFIWIPSILHAAGYDLVRSFSFTLIITLAQLPGYAVAAWLIEAWGRRPTLAVFLLGSAASAVAFGTATTEGTIIGFGMALSFFNLGAWGALYAITPEQYPTAIRGTGAGWAAGVGRIASIIAPLLVPVLLAIGGAPVLFVVFSVFFVIAAAAALLLVDRRGTALE